MLSQHAPQAYLSVLAQDETSFHRHDTSNADLTYTLANQYTDKAPLLNYPGYIVLPGFLFPDQKDFDTLHLN